MHDELFKLQDLHAKPLKSDEHSLFLTHLPHHYYDENQLHAFMISETKDLLMKPSDKPISSFPM
jgi:hypothetical protein